jgi:hypothetical protein
MKLHKNLIKSKNSFAIHMKTKHIELINYFFFRRIFIVLTSDCLCEHSRQTLRHILLFCRDWSEDRQRMLRDDETTNMSRLLSISKNLKISITWLMKINLLTQFSLIKEYLDWNIRHLVRLICYADDFQLLILKATTYKQLKDVVHSTLKRRDVVWE